MRVGSGARSSVLPAVLAITWLFGGAPHATAAPFAYVPHGLSTVSVIDTATNLKVASVPVGVTPIGVAVHPAGTRIYVSNFASGTVSVIDAASNTVLTTVPLGPCPHPSSGIISCAPAGVTVNPGGTRVYVAHVIDSGDPLTVFSGAVSVIDTQDNTVIATLAIRVFIPTGIALSRSGDRLYVTDRALNSVTVIDVHRLQVIGTITVGSNPESIAVDPAGTTLYVTNINFAGSTNASPDIVSVIDAATDQVVASIQVGKGPAGVAVSPDGRRVYVANAFQHVLFGTGTVSVIDAASRSVVKTIPVGLEAYGVAVHPDGTRLYVTNVLSGTVSVIDTATETVVTTVPVGPNSFAVAVGPEPVSPPNPPAIAVTLNTHAIAPGQLVQVSATVANPGAAVAVDLYFVILTPPAIGPSLGCHGGDAIAFLAASGFVVTCASAPPQTFPRWFAGVALGAGVTPIPSFLSFSWPNGAPAGAYTFVLLATPPGAFSDGKIDPQDILAFGLDSLTALP